MGLSDYFHLCLLLVFSIVSVGGNLECPLRLEYSGNATKFDIRSVNLRVQNQKFQDEIRMSEGANVGSATCQGIHSVCIRMTFKLQTGRRHDLLASVFDCADLRNFHSHTGCKVFKQYQLVKVINRFENIKDIEEEDILRVRIKRDQDVLACFHNDASSSLEFWWLGQAMVVFLSVLCPLFH